MKLKIMLLHPNCTPEKKYVKDSGLDVKAKIPKLLSISQFETVKIPLGIAVEPDEGYEVQIRPRSGLALKGIVAELGTIDNEYRGELCAIITNNSTIPYHVQPYERIAQLVVQEITIPEVVYVDTLANTERSQQGFGSTGK